MRSRQENVEPVLQQDRRIEHVPDRDEYVLHFLLLSTLTVSHLVLHPEFKLQYFKNAKWEADWIETAEDIIRIEWTDKWSTMGDAGEVEVEELPAQQVRTLPHVAHVSCTHKYLAE